MWISPNHQDTELSKPLSIDDKITIFLDRTKGWQLDIADQCINKIPHSGFAVLHIVFSYFEMIAKYRGSLTEEGSPSHYFNQGVHFVFPELETTSPQIVNGLSKVFYKDGRCALYHSGITHPKIHLSEYKFIIDFDDKRQLLKINPRLLVQKLKNNLKDYVEQLRDVNNSELRENFEDRFDALFVKSESNK